MGKCKNASILLATKWMCVLHLRATHWPYSRITWWTFPFIFTVWFFLYSYRFEWHVLLWVVPGFFLRKALIGSIEKVFSRALFFFKMDQWFSIICLVLGIVRLNGTVSGNTWEFCVVFRVSNSFLSRSYFSISVSIEDKS